jgi:hypothetical protein
MYTLAHPEIGLLQPVEEWSHERNQTRTLCHQENAKRSDHTQSNKVGLSSSQGIVNEHKTNVQLLSEYNGFALTPNRAILVAD